MKAYKTKVERLRGTDYHEVYGKANSYYKKVKAPTKRKPYIRSAFFNKDKIFLDYFWDHLRQKNWRDRVRRLRYFPCAIDLLKNSKFTPATKQNPNKKNELLHRFGGVTADNEIFFVQVKEDKKTDQKYFISVFPEEL